MLNESVHYSNGTLYVDNVPAAAIAAQTGTPTYVYSKTRVLHNFHALQNAFAALNPHIHYSAKANANLALLRTLVDAGAGIDAVSAGEIARALAAGCSPENIVFAGVGKTPDELRYAVEQSVGWFNVENVDECRILSEIAGSQGKTARVALRYNPDVQANTHPNIATGHKGAKFGLNRDDLLYVLENRASYPNITIEGLHVHVGSQLGDTAATVAGVNAALEIMREYPPLQTLNIGGGFPAQYTDDDLPDYTTFAQALYPLLKDYHVIIEPGRSIVADAGILLARVLYVKEQGGVTLYIVDGSMTELMRPALYGAHHAIVPLQENPATAPITIVGPVCETTDVLGRDVALPTMSHGDLLAILDAGAYGMVMANTYNQRPRPAEVLVDGDAWQVVRKRETLADLIRAEVENA
ncbi:MAG: diaminopimelate decarboxylase [Chloroflexota bacterium]